MATLLSSETSTPVATRASVVDVLAPDVYEAVKPPAVVTNVPPLSQLQVLQTLVLCELRAALRAVSISAAVPVSNFLESKPVDPSHFPEAVLIYEPATQLQSLHTRPSSSFGAVKSVKTVAVLVPFRKPGLQLLVHEPTVFCEPVESVG